MVMMRLERIQVTVELVWLSETIKVSALVVPSAIFPMLSMQRWLKHLLSKRVCKLHNKIGTNSFTIHNDCLQVVQTINNRGFTTTSTSVVYMDYNILLVGLIIL